MNEPMRPHREQRDYSFVTGLVMGTVVGAGLALWLTPGAAAEARDRLAGSAQRVGDELARKGYQARDRVAETVARGAQEVERYAAASRNDRAAL
jgi:gas vesicle protein